MACAKMRRLQGSIRSCNGAVSTFVNKLSYGTRPSCAPPAIGGTSNLATDVVLHALSLPVVLWQIVRTEGVSNLSGLVALNAIALPVALLQFGQECWVLSMQEAALMNGADSEVAVKVSGTLQPAVDMSVTLLGHLTSYGFPTRLLKASKQRL